MRIIIQLFLLLIIPLNTYSQLCDNVGFTSALDWSSQPLSKTWCGTCGTREYAVYNGYIYSPTYWSTTSPLSDWTVRCEFSAGCTRQWSLATGNVCCKNPVITGAPDVNQNQSITLTSNQAGTWTISDATLASLTGSVVTGLNGGTVIITQTVNGGCKSTKSVMVSVPLTLTLFSFTCQCQDSGNLLTWSSRSSNASAINIQSSMDGVHFNTLGTITSLTGEDFEFFDPSRNNFYRLESISSTGVSSFSYIISALESPNKNNDYNIIPLPVLGDSFILSNNWTNFNYEIIDPLGRILTQGLGTSRAERIDVNLIPTGTYILKVITTQFIKAIPVIIQK